MTTLRRIAEALERIATALESRRPPEMQIEFPEPLSEDEARKLRDEWSRDQRLRVTARTHW